ncbi:MAG: ABC transporter ATP-binding protein/permease [Burkholderiales bacterium]
MSSSNPPSSFGRDVWSLIGPFWKSEQKKAAWILLISVLALTLALVYVEVLFNDWYNRFYTALQHKAKDDFFKEMGWFMVLATVWIIMTVYATYLAQLLQIRWRTWLTTSVTGDWLSNRNYYRLQLKDQQNDNPDQRIAEDLKIFVSTTLNLSLGLLSAVVTFVTFVTLLWNQSGPLAFSIGEVHISIPGYMVWVALIYAGVGSWLILKVGRPLVTINNDQQRYEADYRFSLARFRENTEGVALYKGEKHELEQFDLRFSSVVKNWLLMMKRQKLLGWWQYGYGQLAVPFPYLVAAPRYFSGAFELGGLMQIANTFGQVKGSLSWFVNAFDSLATWKATSNRIVGFRRALAEAQRESATAQGPQVLAGMDKDVVFQNLDIRLPEGSPIVAAPAFSIGPAERLLIKGPTGCGKSTLFRSIAGIWPFGQGQIKVPENFDVLFVPQRPYFPLGSLRIALSYPSSAGTFPDEVLRTALADVGLPHLAQRLDEERSWGMQLSGGEQQRIAIARAILQKPRWLFLDEATASLDDASQDSMYQILTERLSNTTIVSIGHRANLARFHSRVVELRPGEAGASRLVLSTS